jgi:peptidoglycan/LPS O-acetylase OafA/YrhL
VVANARIYFLGRVAVDDHCIWSDSLVQFECFAAGILLCLAMRNRVCRFAIWQRLLLIAGGWSCWFFACDKLHSNFDYASDNPGSWSIMGGYALGALGATLMLLAFLDASPKLLPRWFIYLGRISYGLYVYHEFAIDITTRFIFRQASRIEAPILFLKIGVELGLIVLVAALSYRFFETPFLKMKKRHEIIDSEPILDAPG